MNISTWEQGKQDELLFWKGWLSGKGHHYQRPHRLISRLDFMISDKKSVKIANLGAGAMSLIGEQRPNTKVEIIASDILADEYARLRAEFNIKAFNPVQRQDMTNLTYNDSSFDIVYCANALDHCHNPRQALQEMVRICKSGGFVYLRHFVHEGKRHNYHGLHQWNLDITQNNDCQIWKKQELQTNIFLLSDIYPGFTTSVEPAGKTMIITSFVQKR